MMTGSIISQATASSIARIRRRPDWEMRLKGWIDRAQNERFVPGKCDCLLAMGDAVREMTDADPCARYRGQYADLEDGIKMVMRLTGVPYFVGAVSAELVMHGLEPIERNFAARGDVVMGMQRDGPTWGVVDLSGQRVVFAARDANLIWVPLSATEQAWRVGY